MKNFKEFVKPSEELKATEEAEKQHRRDETVGYFNTLKEVIDEAKGFYHPGDIVAELIDGRWRAGWYTDQELDPRTLPIIPNITIVYARVDNDGLNYIKSIDGNVAKIPDLYILEKLMSAEGLILYSTNRKQEDGVVARVFVANNDEAGKNNEDGDKDRKKLVYHVMS